MGKVNKSVLPRELRRLWPVNKNDQRPLNWELRRTSTRSKYDKRLFCIELKNTKTRHSTSIALTKARTAKRVLLGKSRRQQPVNKDHQRPLNEDLRKVQGNNDKHPIELKTETSEDIMTVDMETMETTDKESENVPEWEKENADPKNMMKTRGGNKVAQSQTKKKKNALSGELRKLQAVNKNDQTSLITPRTQGNTEEREKYAKRLFRLELKATKTRSKAVWPQEDTDSPNVIKTRGCNKVAQSKRKKKKNALSGELRKLQAVNKNDQTPLIRPRALGNTEEREKYADAKRLFRLELKDTKTRSKDVWPQVAKTPSQETDKRAKDRHVKTSKPINKTREDTTNREAENVKTTGKENEDASGWEEGNTQPQTAMTNETVQPQTAMTNETVQPQTVMTNETVQPQTVMTNETVQPQTVMTNETVQPQTVMTNETVQPQTAMTNETVQPQTVMTNDTVQPQTVMTNDTVQPQTVMTNDTVQPQTVMTNDTVQPQTVMTNDTVQPQTVMTNKTANPQTVMQDTVVNAQSEEIFETTQTTAHGVPSSQFVGYYYFDGKDKKAHTLLSNLCCLEKEEDISVPQENSRHKMRMSKRLTTAIVKEQLEVERELDIEKKLRQNCEDGLKKASMGEKGRGVVSTREFQKGDFVVEYAGELISKATASQREARYAQDDHTGCYMLYFACKGRRLCVDATAETGRLGRLVNHSRRGNCRAEVAILDQVPHVIFLADRQIPEGEEITVDYGDRSAESVKYHPWLRD